MTMATVIAFGRTRSTALANGCQQCLLVVRLAGSQPALASAFSEIDEHDHAELRGHPARR